MVTRWLVGMVFVGVLILVAPNKVAAQDCEICHQKKCLEIDPEENMGCIWWENDPYLGTGCDDFEMWCGVSFNIDLTGLPAEASLVAGFTAESPEWIRRGCDDAVLKFNFTGDEVARLSRETEFITL